ncbi:hypothetical protein LguiA_034613 [Lonicera macranthoides]
MRGNLVLGKELAGASRGRNMRSQVAFDWLRGMSLVRTGVGWVGSGVAGVLGMSFRRVIEPLELMTKPKLMDGLGVGLVEAGC